MLSKVHAAALYGVEAIPVEVEVHVGPGEERIVIVGLPDAAVRESVERVSTALTNSGFRLPPGKQPSILPRLIYARRVQISIWPLHLPG